MRILNLAVAIASSLLLGATGQVGPDGTYVKHVSIAQPLNGKYYFLATDSTGALAGSGGGSSAYIQDGNYPERVAVMGMGPNGVLVYLKLDSTGALVSSAATSSAINHSTISTVPSASSVTLTPFSNITGNAQIQTIVNDGSLTTASGGCYTLFTPSTGTAFTWITGGNILNSGSGTLNTMYQACWNGTGFIIK
jgi:hypothetical protein